MVTLRAASDDEKEARDRLTHAEWGGGLTPGQFVARERRLRAHPWAAGGMTTWLLADGDVVLASCETFLMESALDGAAGASFGIASVFVEPALRGRGRATELLGRLGERLARLEGAQSLILFSDVGARIYQRVGYGPRPAFDRVLEPAAGPPEAIVDALASEERLAAALARVRLPDDRFAIAPSAAQLDWHRERERCYAELLGRPRPRGAGARAGESTILWAGDLRKGELAVLLLDARSPADERALLECARRVAAEARLDRVRAWEARVDVAPAPDAVPRPGALPMLRPLAPSLAADDWRFVPRALWV